MGASRVMSRNLRNLFRRREARIPSHRRVCTQLRLEQLEERNLLALTVTGTTTDGNLLRDAILGPGVVPFGNATFVGSLVSAGFFTGGAPSIGIASGIVLTTGDANLASGPNISDSASGLASGAGDADLTSALGALALLSTDTTALEFDFQLASAGDLFFNFVFASEEYNEFASRNFNDLFAFLVDGANIAFIPGTTTPVSVNTVNGGNPLGTGPQHPEFYRNNDPSDQGLFLMELGYDGFTEVFTASVRGLSAGVHHAKLAISDVSDEILDSAVFIEAASLAVVGQTTGGALVYLENDPATVIDPGLTFTGLNSPNLIGATVSIAAGFAGAQDVLAFSNQLGITGSYNATAGVLTLSGSTSVANYQTALRSVTYQNTSDFPNTTPRTISFTVTDGTSSGVATRMINVFAVNDAPVLTAANPTDSTDENTPITLALSSFINAGAGSTTITDIDGPQLGGMAIIGAVGNGTFAFSTTGAAPFTSVTTPVSPTSALLLPNTAAVRYTPNALNGETVTITYRAWDQSSGTAGTRANANSPGPTSAFSANTDTATLNVTNVNDAPVPTADTRANSAQYVVNNSIPTTPSRSVLANDTDVDTNDTLTVTNTNSMLTTLGAMVKLNANGTFTYTPPNTPPFSNLTLGNTLQDSFMYDLTDGTAPITGVLVELDVVVNQQPVAVTDRYTAASPTYPGLIGTNEDTVFTVNNVLNGVRNNDSDPDAGDTISVVAETIASANGASVQINANGTFTYNPTVPAAAALQALRQGNSITDTFTYKLRDNRGAEVQGTASVTVNGVNDAPTLAGAVANQAVNDNATIQPFSGILIADVDTNPSPQSQTAIVTIETPANGTFTAGSLGGFVQGPAGTFTFNGTAAQVTTAIRGLVFQPTANQVPPGSTVTTRFTVSANDGVAPAVTNNTTTVIATSINDAPVLVPSGVRTLTGTNEDTTSPATTVANIIGTTVTDVDNAAVRGIAITGTTGNGTWQFATNGVFNLVGAVSGSSALLLRSTDSLRYLPDLQNGENATITYRAWDQTSGTFGTKVNIGGTGGATAFSSATDAATLTVTSVNDAPVLTPSGARTLTAINEDPIANPGNSVASVVGGTITDVDNGAQQGIAVFGVDNTLGSWQFSTNGGTTFTNFGTPSANAARLLRSQDVVRFVPTANFFGTATLQYRAWDQTSGAFGNTVAISTTGGASAFSTASDTATITSERGVVIIDGTPAGDDYVLQPNGTDTEVLLNNVVIFALPSSLIESLTINGLDGNDTLIIRETADGLPTIGGTLPVGKDNPHIPNAPSIRFNGGSGNDALRYEFISNGVNQTYAIGDGVGGGSGLGTSEGEILTVAGNATNHIYFTGLEPISVVGTPGGTLTILGDVDANDFVIEANGSNTRVRASTGGNPFESFEFPAGSFANVLIDGLSGNDTFNVTGLGPDFTANFTIDGGGGVDGVRFVGPTNLVTDNLPNLAMGNVTAIAENIQVSSAVTTADGNILLNAGGRIVVDAAGRLDVQSATASVTLNAGLDIFMRDGSRASAAGGNITFEAGLGVQISRLVTTGMGTVTVTTREGGIADGGDSGGADIEAASAVLSAGTSVGTRVESTAGIVLNKLETRVQQIDVTAGSGGIFVANSGTLHVKRMESSGLIDITTMSPLTVTGTVHGTVVSLTASPSAAGSGPPDNLTIGAGATVRATAGAVTLSAGSNVLVAPTAVISATGGVVVNAHTSGTANIAPASVVSLLRNPVNSADVNGDGRVTSLDVFSLIAALRSADRLSSPISVANAAAAPLFYWDADGDGQLTPLDVFRVIAVVRGAVVSAPTVNAQSLGSASGEGEASPATLVQPTWPLNPPSANVTAVAANPATQNAIAPLVVGRSPWITAPDQQVERAATETDGDVDNYLELVDRVFATIDDLHLRFTEFNLVG